MTVYSPREVMKLNEEYAGLDWTEITTVCGPVRWLLLTPKCEYCGCPNAQVQCIKCGAGVRDGLR